MKFKIDFLRKRDTDYIALIFTNIIYITIMLNKGILNDLAQYYYFSKTIIFIIYLLTYNIIRITNDFASINLYNYRYIPYIYRIKTYIDTYFNLLLINIILLITYYIPIPNNLYREIWKDLTLIIHYFFIIYISVYSFVLIVINNSLFNELRDINKELKEEESKKIKDFNSFKIYIEVLLKEILEKLNKGD